MLLNLKQKKNKTKQKTTKTGKMKIPEQEQVKQPFEQPRPGCLNILVCL